MITSVLLLEASEDSAVLFRPSAKMSASVALVVALSPAFLSPGVGSGAGRTNDLKRSSAGSSWCCSAAAFVSLLLMCAAAAAAACSSVVRLVLGFATGGGGIVATGSGVCDRGRRAA